MPEEGFIMEEGELVNKGPIVLMYSNKCPESESSLSCCN